MIALVFLIAVCLSVSLWHLPGCEAEFAVKAYSNAQCTAPTTLFPAVVNTQLSLLSSTAVCVAASSVSGPTLIPSPAPAQWYGYYCSPSSAYPGKYSLDLRTFDYSTPTGGCPFNYSSPTRNHNSSLQSNPSVQGANGNSSCQYMQWAVYSQATASLNVTVLYGSFSCTNTTSGTSLSAVVSRAWTLSCIVGMVVLMQSMHL